MGNHNLEFYINHTDRDVVCIERYLNKRKLNKNPKLTRMKKVVIFLILGIFMINLVCASITCTKDLIERTNLVNETPTSETFSCTNNDLNISVSVSKTGSFFSTTPTIISILPSETKTITVNFNKATTPGLFEGYLTFSDFSSPVTIRINISAPVIPEQKYDLIVFPTAKVVNVQQGQSKTFNVQLIVPSNYPRPVTVQSISFNPDIDVLTLGDLDMGTISPGQTLNIPITAQGKDIQTGTYSTQLNILVTDSLGRIDIPSPNLQVVVSVGVNPSTNATFSTPPSCALSSVTMSINSSYTLTCSNAIDNIEISPQYNEYIEGIKAEISSGIYAYTFRPTKMGNTQFITIFTYKGSPIFQPYKQEIRISSTGLSVAGTDLSFIFSPNLDALQNNQQVIIQLIDNKSNSLVESPGLYIDSIPINPLNNSLKSFLFTMQIGKNYQLRGTSPSYNDIIRIINISIKDLPYTIIGEKNPFKTGDMLNINSSVESVSYLLNDVIIQMPYYLAQEGIFTLKLVKEGYLTTIKNISVIRSVQVSSCSPLKEDWKKGKEVTCSLTQISSWEVYLNSTLINSGNSSTVNFKINNYGLIEIKAEGLSISQVTIEKKGLFGFEWLRLNNYWIYVILAIGIFVLWLMFKKGKEDEDKLTFVGQSQGE